MADLESEKVGGKRTLASRSDAGREHMLGRGGGGEGGWVPLAQC